MTVSSLFLFTSVGSAQVSLGASSPWRKSVRREGYTRFSYLDGIRIGGGKPFLKSVPVHAIDLRQIEPSYKVRLRWVICSVFLNGLKSVGRLSRRSPGNLCRSDLAKSCSRACARLCRGDQQIAARHEQQLRAVLRKVPTTQALRYLNRQSKRYI